MALDGTYIGLQASVIDWLFGRQHLATYVPDWVRIAEAQLNARLRLAEMLVTDTLSVTGEVYSLPSDVAGVVSVAALTNPRRTLQLVDGAAKDIPRRAGMPNMYTLSGDEIAVWPSNASDIEVTYYQKLPSIIDNGTNWLLTSAPQVYLYATLLQAAPFMEDEAMLRTWAGMLDNEISALNARDTANRLGGSRVRASGVTP